MSAYLDALAEKYAAIFVAAFDGIDETLWTKPWLCGGIAPQQNLSGTVYNGTNRFATLANVSKNGYRTNIWGTFLQWKELGITIRRGEQSVPVCKFDFYVKDTVNNRRSQVTVDEYRQMSAAEREEKGLELRRDIYNFSVFNADQTNLSEVYPDAYESLVRASVASDHSVDLASVDSLISRSTGWICPVAVVEGREPSYHRGLGVVYTPGKEAYKTNRDFYATLFRSLAHSTGVKGALDRASLGETSLEGVAREELTCEFASALCCNRVGLDATLARDNVQYLKIWTEKIGRDPKVIYSILKDAVKASDMILSAIGLGREEGIDVRPSLGMDVKAIEAKRQESREEKTRRRRVSKMARGVKHS